MIKIKDNYIKKEDMKNIKNMFLSNLFPWYVNTNKTSIDPKEYTKDKNDYQLTHTFVANGEVNSNAYENLLPIINKMKVKNFIRIKANLVPNTDKIYKFEKHKDQDLDCKAAIFYINTNNGLTIFDKEKVKAKENRMVFFKGNQIHQGTTCTDQKFKLLINFNYN